MRGASCTRPDWAGDLPTYALIWGPPIVVIVGGLFVEVALRAFAWTIALLWMGTACLLNVRRCARTHCRFTGPFYLVMILPVWTAETGIIPTGVYGWALLAAFIIIGGKIIWWATERAWGKFS